MNKMKCKLNLTFLYLYFLSDLYAFLFRLICKNEYSNILINTSYHISEI